jgi:uncharacterized membrane protein YfcA
MSPIEVILIGGLGVAAGLIGGLAGVGGSMVMLPGLHLVWPEAAPEEHHLFVAAAMTVNVAVAIPAAIQHARAGAVRSELLATICLSALAFIVLGVVVSNRVPGDALSVLLGVFILCYCGYNVWRTARGRGGDDDRPERISRVRLAVSGASAGMTAGLLGLGGGVVLVPLLQVLCRIRLKQAIATSSAVICVTSTLGAALKVATLPEHGQEIGRALVLAGVMAPGAVVGGVVGARVTHALPVKGVRIAITVLLALAAVNLVRRGL